MVDRNAILAVSVLAVFVAVAGALFAVGGNGDSGDVGAFASEPVRPIFSELPDVQDSSVQQQSNVKVITSSGSGSDDSNCVEYSERTKEYVNIC